MRFVVNKSNNSKSSQYPCDIHRTIPTITFASLNSPCLLRLTEEFNFAVVVKICNLRHTKGKTQKDWYLLLLIYLSTFNVLPCRRPWQMNLGSPFLSEWPYL